MTMKKIMILFAFFALIMSCNNTENQETVAVDEQLQVEDTSLKSFSSPIRYNDYIIGLQMNVYNKIIELVKCFEICDDEELKKSYNEFGEEAKKSAEEIRRLDSFNGNTQFRENATQLFDFYVDVYENAYKELIDFIIKGDNSEKAQARMNKIVEEISASETKYDNAFQTAQQQFATENNIEIIENEMQTEIDNM